MIAPPCWTSSRHFEACLVVQILAALNNGDLYVEGADEFGDPFPRLCSWEEYHLRIAGYGAQLGFSVSPDTFVADQQRWLANIATTDCAFPDNDKVALVDGHPVIRRPKRAQDPPGLGDLKRQLEGRRLPRPILDVLADTSHWLNWTSFFEPLSGLESKLDDTLERNLASDTQGQNEAIFGMALLRGIEMMPRIRDWRDLIFYRPYAGATYEHIDAVFSDKVIDWELIRTHLPDMLRIALSIKEGRTAP